MNQHAPQDRYPLRARALWALALLVVASLAGCASPRLDFGGKRARRKPASSSVSDTDFELDLQLLGDRRHRFAVQVRGKDVRRLLPRTALQVAVKDWVFAVLPVGRTWRRVGWRAARITAITPQGATLITEERRTFVDVPPAMIVPQAPGALKPGQVVRVHSGRHLPFGRVSALRLGRVEVRVPWLDRTRLVDARRREVLPLREGLYPAAPVIYRYVTNLRLGTLITVDRDHCWVLGAEGVIHRLATAQVEPFSIARHYKPGDQVRAALPIGLKLASVTRVLDHHVLYEVSWSQTRRSRVAFSQLAPLPTR